VHNLIQDGPPILATVTHTDDPGIAARVLCLVDGYAAEIVHDVNTKRQEYNTHVLRMFDPQEMTWREILRWGFTEAGHVPIHPDSETVGHLAGLSEVMWAQANVIVGQSRMRQEEIDVAQFVAEQMALQERMTDYREAESEESATHPILLGDEGEADDAPLASDAQLAELRTKLAGDA
jgi:hypothetical protein